MPTIAWTVIIGVPTLLIVLVVVAALRDRSVKQYKRRVLEAAEQDAFCRYHTTEWYKCREEHQADMSIDEWKTDGMFYQGEVFCGPKPLC